MKNPDRGVHKTQSSPSAGGANSVATQRQEITERERAESELRRLRRALLTISQCNHAVVRAQSEQELLESVCRNMVDAGVYRLAWVGVANQDKNKTITPVAYSGFEDGYLQSDKITWADTERGRGPAGTAIRTGKTAIARNIQVDPNMLVWRDEALKRGYASSIALPILLSGRVFGALAIYAEEPDAFDSAEVKLLTELTEDLAYGIQALRTKAELRLAAEALGREKAFTDAVIDSFPDVFFVIQATGKFLHWGRNPEKVLGYTREETMAMESALEIVAEEDRPLAAHAIEEAFTRGNTAVEVNLLHRDGSKIPYLVRATRAVIGEATYMVGLGLDISERKQAEEALRQSEAALKEALLAAQMGVWNWTVATDTVAWDENLFRIAGRDNTLPAPSYQEHSQCYASESWERLKSAVEDALATGTPYVLDLEMLRSDGSKRWLIGRGEPVRDANGQITQLRGTVQDITDRRVAEQRVRESEEKFRKAFMTGADASYYRDLEGRQAH
jgi:PAS domain S-box-containing protein